ncbi:hypothetical protein V500_02489 [Pseudogymnoascus sp. VKM F-4518 (FW-2643)]|nr:hypothetical protein V500_02489 [Pseudogymnoascus sp. VKM F-4518 (FW-2643)]
MTSPPHPAPPPLSLHLADTALKPLLSTAPPTSSQAKNLRALTTAALSAHTSASRLGLGYPVHILVETKDGGPVAMHAFLDPEARRGDALKNTGLLDVHSVGEEEPRLRSSRGSPEAAGEERREGVEHGEGHSQSQGHAELTNGVEAMHIGAPTVEEGGEEEEEGPPLAPMLVATVVAESHNRMSEARRAVRRLEGMGRGFQEQWVREREDEESETTLGDREVEGPGTTGSGAQGS